MAMTKLRMSQHDIDRRKMLTERLAVKLQCNFIAGGDNTALKAECDDLARQVREIDSKYSEDAA